jgi:beta-N-acetylhexosaminidase
LQALQAEGLLGCAKHFPGHGDTHQDSHHELPLLELTRQQLFNRELAPFQALIEADVSFIMTAHILFPRIDPLWPATLSKVLLHDILRGQLAFSGVIVGDDLDMKAVSKGFEDSSNVAQAIKAGCDMFIVARHPDGSSLRPLNLAQSFVENLSARRISEDELFASFERIKHALLKLKHYAPAQLDQNTLERHAELARA